MFFLSRIVTSIAVLAVSFVLLTCVACCDSARAQPLDPLRFPSLGALGLSNGSYTIDTDALTIVDDASPGTPLFLGVADDQNGSADFVGNVWLPGSQGIPEIAVFAFDDVDLESTATINVVGTRAMALVSHGNVMIDTTIDVSGEGVEGVVDVDEFNPVPAGVGRAGGFSGGYTEYTDPITPAAAGDGPGGGGGASTVQGGAGAFGGSGDIFGAPGAPGTPYGDLVFGPLQGGSGGGAVSFSKGGAAGGGALEIAALGAVTLAAGGNLVAAGGDVDESYVGSFEVAGGVGSGGGIRISGQSVDLLGSVDVSASAVHGFGAAFGGGGRVAIMGSNQLFDFTVGVTNPSSIDTSAINAEGGTQTDLTRGLISISPQVTSIPNGESLTLGQATDLSDANRRLELVHRNIRVQHGGEAIVPAEGYVNHDRIELFAGASRIGGAGTVENRGELGGWGTVEVTVLNEADGTIDAVNDVLTFSANVVNNTGGRIDAIGSTLSFPGDGLPTSAGGEISDGLVNHSELTLIHSVVYGDVHSPAGSQINVGGSVEFNGLVSGGGEFSGTSNRVTFNGGYAPGDSPAEIAFGGEVVFGGENSLLIELGGTTPGTEHDRVAVAGSATLGGEMAVSLIDGFVPTPGEEFEVLTYAARSGEFAAFGGTGLINSDTALVPLYGTTELTLVAAIAGDVNLDGVVDGFDANLVSQNFLLAGAYADGDANFDRTVDGLDANLISANFLQMNPPASAIPEPSSLCLLMVAVLIRGMRRPRNRKVRNR